MSNENQIDIFKEPMALSEIFVKSGMFPDIKSQAQGVVKILAGKELGLTPFKLWEVYFLSMVRLGYRQTSVLA